MITDFQKLDTTQTYTYADYLTWQFKERVELIRGYVVRMSPAPNVRHQRISGFIFRKIGTFLEGKTCEVFSAPFDVRLPLPPHKVKGDVINTVVQPDIVVVCDPSRLDEHGCIGPPDIVVEVLSPGNTRREMKDKLELYQSAGIPEYWVVDPDHEFVLVFTVDASGKYNGGVPFTEGSELVSVRLPGFSMDTGSIFARR
jgi:Uma2 family endonuclease